MFKIVSALKISVSPRKVKKESFEKYFSLFDCKDLRKLIPEISGLFQKFSRGNYCSFSLVGI
jgi:hypothetical protein